MKKILKSLFTITVLSFVLFNVTGAWFTSSVTAEDNQIVAGDLRLAIDTPSMTEIGGTGSVWGIHAWNIKYQTEDGTLDSGSGKKFAVWTDATPGESQDYYLGIRNLGNVPTHVRFKISGEWVNGPRFGQTIQVVDHDDGTQTQVNCPARTEWSTFWNRAAEKIIIDSVNQYKSDNCNGDQYCANIYYAYADHSVSQLAGLSANTRTSMIYGDWYYGTVEGSGVGSEIFYNLGENEFALYKTTVKFDETDVVGYENYTDCLQGATYEMDVHLEGQQDGAGIW